MEKEIGKIKKNENTDIVVRIDDFGGRLGVNVREFVNASDSGYTGFTKSGTRIPAERFKQFKDAINSINESDLKANETPEQKESFQDNQDDVEEQTI